MCKALYWTDVPGPTHAHTLSHSLQGDGEKERICYKYLSKRAGGFREDEIRPDRQAQGNVMKPAVYCHAPVEIH